MPDTILLRYTAPTVPEGFCPATWQQVYDALSAAQWRLDSTGYSMYNYGDTTPLPEYRTFPWLRTIGGKPDRWYVYANNLWLSPHQVPASSDIRMIYVGANDAAGLWSFDGGDGTDPSLAGTYTGAMWEVDTNFNARFPIGAGTTANGTVIAVNGTGGADEVTLTADQIPEHTHDVKINKDSPEEADVHESTYANQGYADQYNTYISEANDTDGLAHNNMPPYRGVYIIKRTDRVYYSVPG